MAEFDNIFGSPELNEFKTRVNFPIPKFPWYKSLWFKIRYFFMNWKNILLPLRPLNIQKCPRCRKLFELNFSECGTKRKESLDIYFDSAFKIAESYIECPHCDYYVSLKKVD